MWWWIAAYAAEPDTGWTPYLVAKDRAAEAVDLLEAALQADPTDLELHEAYARVRGRSQYEPAVVLAEYRAWSDQEPRDVHRRLALATALVELHPAPCEDALDALDPLPSDPELLPWTVGLRASLHRKDPSCVLEIPKRVLRRVPPRPGVWPREVDEAVAADMRSYWQRHPRRIGKARWLWGEVRGEPYYSGPFLEQARADAKGAMQHLTQGDDIPTLWAIRLIPELETQQAAARQRLRELEGGDTEHEELEQAVYEARNHVDAGVALARLDALAVSLPAEGELRQRLEGSRYEKLIALERREEAVDAAESAWRANPAKVDSAVWFAQVAARGRTHRDVGLQAIQAALKAHQGQDFRPDWEAQREGQAKGWPTQHTAWITAHHARERELLQILRWYQHQAQLPVSPLPAPLVLDASHYWTQGQGQDDRLGDQFLVRAALLDEERIDAAVHELERRNRWFLAGPRAHIQAWKAQGSLPIDALITAHSLPREPVVGRFPDVPFEVSGQTRTVADYAGIRVVDLWATWCPPCVPALGVLDRIATDYEGRVTVLAIATDSDLATVESATAGAHYQMHIGWSPDGFDSLVRGTVPRLFIVDANGDVLSELEGTVDLDRRLRAALDTLLR